MRHVDMKSVVSSWSESDRLAVLNSFEILDTPREPAFDDIVTLATQLCDAPIALVTLIDRDRQWFKAESGICARETPRSLSVCSVAIEHGALFIVPDLS